MADERSMTIDYRGKRTRRNPGQPTWTLRLRYRPDLKPIHTWTKAWVVTRWLSLRRYELKED